jgi:hypothetical protein
MGLEAGNSKTSICQGLAASSHNGRAKRGQTGRETEREREGERKGKGMKLPLLCRTPFYDKGINSFTLPL